MKIAIELSSLDCARLKKLAERSGKTVEACASFLIAGNSLAEVINDWNSEIDGELEECGVEALDFADEVCII